MISALIVLAALALDALFGEPRRFHPLVGFGRLAQALEQHLHGDSRTRGAIALWLLVAPWTVLALLSDWMFRSVVLDTALLYLAVGWKSLGEHAARVGAALREGDLPEARKRAGFMVSRDTAALDPEAVAKAAVESVLENGNDAIFGAIFWFAVAGAPGVVLYRLGNTLDAMWGHRTDRYRRFGWAAARLDDVLNFIPARLAALSYALVGNFSCALRCWQSQGRHWKSPNAGPVMAAGAGSLDVLLGGAACYQGVMQDRPRLGKGRKANADDIDRALRLVRRTLLLWVLVLMAGGWFVDHVIAA